MNRADKRKFHYIYRINRVDGSGKYYIGLHSTDNLDDGYFGSGTQLAHSIRRHGKDKHEKLILEFLPTREALKLRERQIVNEEIVADPLCMNLKLGGEGGWDHIRNQHIAGKAGAEATNRNFWTPEKRAECMRRAYAIGTKLPTGWSDQARSAAQSAEANAKRSQKMKERTGEKNSQFGTCWVTDGGKPIKIQRALLDDYLLQGYRRGRTHK